jgi:N-acetylmuramoyl-L-alanine amidase
MRNIKWIILHCTAGPQDQSTKVILNYWKNSLGYKTPGYHHLISADGTVDNLVPIEQKSNGVKNFNANSINICYKGGVGPHGEILDNRTSKQIEAMKALVNKYHAMFPNAVICGHRDFSPDRNRNGIIEQNEWMKACPSFSVKKWLEEEGIVSAQPMPNPKKLVATKTGSGVNLRSGPGTHFHINAELKDGTVALINEEKDGWSHVQVADNLNGWIRSDFLK